MLRQERNDDRRVLRTLALVNDRRIGRDQHVEFAEFIGDRSAVEFHSNLTGFGIDLLDVADIASATVDHLVGAALAICPARAQPAPAVAGSFCDPL